MTYQGLPMPEMQERPVGCLPIWEAAFKIGNTIHLGIGFMGCFGGSCEAKPFGNVLAGRQREDPSLMLKLHTPPRKTRKTYRKPELKTLDPQAAIKTLEPLALAGDKSVQQLIQAITDKHGMGSD